MRWAVLLAVVVSLAVYAPSLEHYFVSDDFLNQERNTLRTAADVLHCFATGDVDFYRPIPRLHFGVARALFGGDALAWNLLGLSLHAAAAVLAGALARDLVGPRARRVALFTAFFFAIHFIHVEAVVWASGVTSVYDAIFLFAALLLFRRARRTESVRDRTLSVIAFAGALLSKESSVAFVLLLPLTTWLFPPRGPDGRPTSPRVGVREAAPFAILLAAYLAIVLPIDRGGALSPYRMTPGPHVVKNAAFALLGCFVPVRYWEVQDLWAASTAGGGGGLGAFAAALAGKPALAVPLAAGAGLVALLAVRGTRRVRGLVAWILAAASPHLLLAGSGERFLYVPSFGACALLAIGADAILRRPPRALGGRAGAAASILGVAALCVAGCLDRQGDWSTAGKWTHGIVARWGFLKALDPEESIEFVGIPDRWGSAWVFRNGFSSMVRLAWEGRPYWREEERPRDAVPDSRLGVLLHPGGTVGMLPPELIPEGIESPASP